MTHSYVLESHMLGVQTTHSDRCFSTFLYLQWHSFDGLGSTYLKLSCRLLSLCEFGTTSYLCSNSIWISNASSYLPALLLSQEVCKWLMSPTNKFIALEYKYPLWHRDNSLVKLPVIMVSRDGETVRIQYWTPMMRNVEDDKLEAKHYLSWL